MLGAGALAPLGAAAAIPVPDDDPFYVPPAGLKKKPRGAVLRSREVDVTGAGFPIPVDAWQVLYRTKDTLGRPIATVATIIVPPTPWAGQGPRPLVSYQTAIDSLGTQCNPSYRFRAGTEKEEIAVLPAALAEGWAILVSDYEGPRMAYTAGKLAARTALDGVRAAERFKADGLAGRKTPVGFWGYSGGGQATAWTAEQQPSYAPKLNVKGFAEGGVPPNVGQVARQIDGGPFAGVFFAASVGLNREFPKMRLGRILNAAGKAMVKEISTQCSDTLVTGYPFQHISQYTKPKYPDPLAIPRMKRIIRADRLPKHFPTAPVYLYHSVLDELIPVAGPDGLFSRYCEGGVTVQYERAATGEHIGYAFTGAPQAILWLADRFAGNPAPSNC
jgi:hypothetical protein